MEIQLHNLVQVLMMQQQLITVTLIVFKQLVQHKVVRLIQLHNLVQILMIQQQQLIIVILIVLKQLVQHKVMQPIWIQVQ